MEATVASILVSHLHDSGMEGSQDARLFEINLQDLSLSFPLAEDTSLSLLSMETALALGLVPAFCLAPVPLPLALVPPAAGFLPLFFPDLTPAFLAFLVICRLLMMSVLFFSVSSNVLMTWSAPPKI